MPLSDFLPKTGAQRELRELPGVSPFAGDDGTCPAHLAAALALTGPERLVAVVQALASARVLVPILAHEESEHDADTRERILGHRVRGAQQEAPVGEKSEASQEAETAASDDDAQVIQAWDVIPPASDSCHDGEERTASASMVTLRTPDGRSALPAFTSVAALAAWRSDARPVPHEAVRAAMAAVDEASGVMVLDAGSGDPVVIPRPAVWALARGEAWIPALSDPAVTEAVTAAVSAVNGIERVSVSEGNRAEVKVTAALVAGLSREQVQGIAQEVSVALAESVVVAERVDSLELAFTTA